MTEFQKRLEANIRESLRFAVGEVDDEAVAHMVAGVNAVLKHPSAPKPSFHLDVPEVDWLQTCLNVIREHKRAYQAERDDRKQRGKANAHVYAALLSVCDSIENSLVTLWNDDTPSPQPREGS